MAKRIEMVDLSCYYGRFKAVDSVSVSIEPKTVTAFIGPSGCGKSTLLRAVNRLHEVVLGTRIDGQVLLNDKDIYAAGIDPVAVRRVIGMVFRKPNPFPTMSIYDNVAAGLRLNGVRKKSELDDAVERSLTAANLWKEVRDRLGKPGAVTFRRPAAAGVHRAGDRRRAAGPADGRAVQRTRPDLDTRHR